MIATPHPWTAFDTVRDAIESRGTHSRARGPHALMASCPLHEDATPSLSITWTPRAGRPGMVLMHCFACRAPIGDLAAGLGLRLGDLFDDAAPTRRPAHAAPTPRAPTSTRRRSTAAPPPGAGEHRWQRVRVYTYTTVSGRPVQQVLRDECRCGTATHKRFLQRYRHGRAWAWRKPPDFRPVLYRARELAAADPARWVWLVEGEKDADTAASLGRVATTNAQGAGHFPPELLAALAGRKVLVVVDRDAAGQQRGLALHAALRGHAAELQILLPGPAHPKADLTDHVTAGLWNPDDRFGGLAPITAADLEQLQQPRRTQKDLPCSPHR